MTEFNPSYIGIRHDLIKHISGEKLTILDVGCANGANGKYLQEKGIADFVYGIEYDEAMANIAENFYAKVFTGDLNSAVFLDDIVESTPKCDYIICGDVLEHLLNAKDVLRKLTQVLKENGRIIISVPNIAHIELFIQVYLKGEWPRNDRGIFDKTHLTWFTKKNLLSMINEVGLVCEDYSTNTRARDAIGSKFSLLYKVIRVIKPELFTFQHIVNCRKK